MKAIPKERLRDALAVLLLLGWTAFVGSEAWARSEKRLGWPDEWIYLTVARNVSERGDLNTRFYLANSLEKLGYPHRDVHLPGYALTLAAASAVRGGTPEERFSIATGAALNATAFALGALATFSLARRFLDPARAALAAGLVVASPPFPGYLAIVFPEHVTWTALIATLALAARVTSPAATALAGALAGLSWLYRETLLFALPVFVALLGARRAARQFLPGLAAALILVVAPLARDRAVHPNALYPSAVTEALRSDAPVARLTETILANATWNLRLLFSSDPSRAEDATLLFLLGVILAGALAHLRGATERATLVRAAALSTALLFVAMIFLYVVRERGGVWGGVRALMPMVPLFVIGLVGAIRSRVLLLAMLFVWTLVGFQIGDRQIRAFNRDKQVAIEDQTRAADFIEERSRRFLPRRVVGGRYFLYGYRNFPVEVVWSGIHETADLDRVHRVAPFDLVVLHRRSPIRFDLRKDPRYEWVNRDEGQPAEYHLFRRVLP
jgi:hypothetical protein